MYAVATNGRGRWKHSETHSNTYFTVSLTSYDRALRTRLKVRALHRAKCFGLLIQLRDSVTFALTAMTQCVRGPVCGVLITHGPQSSPAAWANVSAVPFAHSACADWRGVSLGGHLITAREALQEPGAAGQRSLPVSEKRQTMTGYKAGGQRRRAQRHTAPAAQEDR